MLKLRYNAKKTDKTLKTAAVAGPESAHESTKIKSDTKN